MSTAAQRSDKIRPDAPRVWLRIDRAHIAKVIKARRALCVGEEVRL